MRRVGSSILLMCVVVGCKASVNAEARASSSGASASAEGDLEGPDSQMNVSDDLDKPLDPNSLAAGAAAYTGPVLLGARRDLSYAGPAKATCSCLAVQLGAPESSAFKWVPAVPNVDTSRQLVVALSSEGVACDEATGLGASYKGYIVSGHDVVVMVERAHEGRPVASGAVIPRPMGSGRVYVVAAEKGSPYGGAVGNPRERCRLEMPAELMAVGSGPGTEVMTVAEQPEPEPLPEDSNEFVEVDEGQLSEDKLLQEPRTRDGFLLALHPNASYLMLRERGVDAQYRGPGFGLDALIGGSPTEGLSVGAILGGATFPTPDFKVQGATLASDADLNLFHIGGFVDYYPDARSGLHALAELAYARIGASGARTATQDIQGLGIAGGVGYDWWVSDNWSLGLLGRFTFGAMRHQQVASNYWLLLPGLNFTATYH